MATDHISSKAGMDRQFSLNVVYSRCHFGATFMLGQLCRTDLPDPLHCQIAFLGFYSQLLFRVLSVLQLEFDLLINEVGLASALNRDCVGPPNIGRLAMAMDDRNRPNH